MKRFILVFILTILLLSFVAAFLYMAKYKNSPSVELSPNPEMTNQPQDITTPEVTGLGPSIYENYSKQKYDQALVEGRIVLLYFTANWSEDCRTQDMINTEVVSSLTDSGVVGLRVHILDSESTLETAGLAQKFSVVKENTILILDTKGAVYFKQTGETTNEVLKEAILEATQTIPKEVIPQ